MRSNHAFVSLIVLLILFPLQARTQDIPKHRAMSWISKMQITEQFNRKDASAFTTATESHQLKRMLQQLWNEAEWSDDVETKYTFNGADPVSEEINTWDGSGWAPIRKVSYLQGENNPMGTILYENYTGGQYVPEDRYLLYYGFDFFTGEFILNHMEYEVWTGSEWEKVSKESFIYTAQSFVLYMSGWISYDWTGDAYEKVQKSRMVESGDDLFQTDYMWSENWVPLGRTVYMNTTLPDYVQIASKIEEQAKTYLSLPLLIADLPDFYEQDWDGSIWTFKNRTERIKTYDWGSGRILQQKIEILEWDHHLWIPGMAYVVDYDDNEMPYRAGLEFLMDEESLQEEPFRFTEDVFEYDDRGLLHSAVFRMNNGEELQNIFRHEFEWAGTGTGIGGNDDFPQGYHLGNAWPNPFNPSAVIPYETGAAGHVTIRVYDILGRQVATLYNGEQTAGSHQVRFEASGLTSGKYLVRMVAPGYSQTRAVTLLK